MTLPQRYCENRPFLPLSPQPRHVRNGFLKSAPFSESEKFIKPFCLRCLIKHELAPGLLPYSIILAPLPTPQVFQTISPKILFQTAQNTKLTFRYLP